MQHFVYPTDFESIKVLVDDANALAEDNARLKRLVKGKLKDHARSSGSTDAPKPAAKPAAKPPSKPPSKPAAKPVAKPGLTKLSLVSPKNSANAWADAPSVSEVALKSDGKKKIRPVEPDTDSDDDTPLPKKSKPTVAAAKKPKEGKKEKAFKGMTAYNIYFGERTTSLRQESPEMDRGEVAKLTGTEWKSLTPDEKVPYAEKAAERNIVKRAAYDAAKANGNVSTLESCVANHSDDTDDDDDE